MARGEKRLKLAHPVNDGHGRDDGYEVIEVINSVSINPGSILTKREVAELIDCGLYNVTTVAKRREK